jgi:phospholipase/carboxylesterase
MEMQQIQHLKLCKAVLYNQPYEVSIQRLIIKGFHIALEVTRLIIDEQSGQAQEGGIMITATETLKGHLTSRPTFSVPVNEFITGVQPLRLDRIRDGLFYIPKAYTHETPAAFALMLHGAGGEADHGLHLLKEYADEKNVILLSPASRATTWDIIAKDAFNGDVLFIDQALALVFKNFNIDSRHLAIGGFSDGASYALSMGLGNGDLFTHIIAFSPGFYHTVENKGKPRIYISHGVRDHILPIAPCSRRIVPRLKRLNYEINYNEFQGEHEIPGHIATGAVNWFLKP